MELMSLSDSLPLETLQLVFKQLFLVGDLARPSLVYTLYHGQVLGMLTVFLLEHFKLSFALGDLLITQPADDQRRLKMSVP
jgi:hypothetical protein